MGDGGWRMADGGGGMGDGDWGGGRQTLHKTFLNPQYWCAAGAGGFFLKLKAASTREIKGHL